MTIRSRTIAATLFAATLATTSGAVAGDLISPASVLADKGPQRGVSGFSDRTARIRSIMGPELGGPAVRRVSTRSPRGQAIRRDADATAGLR